MTSSQNQNLIAAIETTQSNQTISLNEKAQNLLSYANEKRKDGVFTDVIIKVDEFQFPANRMILSCFSKYFETTFNSKMKEQYEGSIQLSGFDPDVVKMLIDYMYAEEIVITSDNVDQVLRAADYMLLTDVKECCLKFLVQNLTEENCLIAFTLFKLYSDSTPNQVYEFIERNFDCVFEQEMFKKFSENDLNVLFEKILSRVNQKSAFYAVAGWVSFNEQERAADFVKLFKQINCFQISEKDLREILEHRYVKNDLFCKNAVLETVVKKNEELRESENDSTIFCVGGSNKTDSNKTTVVEIHSLYVKSNLSFPSLLDNVSWHCVVKIDQFVYCIGGAINDISLNSTNKVYCLDLNASEVKWNEVASMKKNRSGHASAIFKGNIVVTGGNLEGGDLVELYDIKQDSWKLLEKMNNDRIGHELVVHDGDLYAVGGKSQEAITKSAEKLSELNENWQSVNPMKTPRFRFAAVNCREAIYVIGGKSTKPAEQSVEIYSSKSKQWSFTGNLNIERWGHSACVFRGRIFILGGWDKTSTTRKEMESYDTKTESWSLAGDKIDVTGHALLVV